MGRMVEGEWRDDWYVPDAEGNFRRPETSFRARVGSAEHPVEAGRYHLYVSHACPWAHRTLVTRALRGLEDAIGVTVVDPHMGAQGWPIAESDPDPYHPDAKYLHDVYRAARSDYTGRVTVPVLWDRERATIVNNESREIMRMMNVELEPLAKRGPTLAPEALRPRIDEVLSAIYEPINNGVYRAGFATTQRAYERAVGELFAALDHWDGVLSEQRYLLGDVLTEADIALFTTLLRFDLVYYAHFKCNVRRIQDYGALSGYLRDIYQRPLVRATCHLDEIKLHYYWSQESVNPHRVVPVGPTLDLDAPHDRERLGPASSPRS